MADISRVTNIETDERRDHDSSLGFSMCHGTTPVATSDRGRQAGEAVADHDQDVLDTAGVELADDAGPELGPFGGLDPDAQDLLAAISIDPAREVRGLV